MSATDSTDGAEHRLADTNISRRRAMQLAGAVMVAAGSAGLAQADGDAINYASDYSANPFLSATVTKDRHREGWDLVDYLDDDGEQATLPAVIDYRDPDDKEETIQSVIGINAAYVDADDYRAFPRDVETDEDDEDDREDVSAIDSDYWSTSDAELTVEDGNGEIDSVVFDADGVAADSTVSATFDADDYTDLLVEDDVERRFFAVGVTVSELSADSTVELIAESSGGETVSLSIDPDGDDADDDVIATSTVTGAIAQARIGDLDGGDDLDDVESVSVEISDADAEIELFALNLERMSRWEFGTRVVDENTDDEETETVREPSGDVDLAELGGIAESSTIYNMDLPVKYDAASSELGTHVSSADADSWPAFDVLFEQVERIEVTTGYDLSHSGVSLEIEETLPSGRYESVEVAEDTSDDDEPDDMDFSDESDALGADDGYAVLESLPTTGTEYAVRTELLLTDGEHDEATDPSAAAPGARGTADGFFSGVRGMISAVVIGVLGFLGIRRFAAGGD